MHTHYFSHQNAREMQVVQVPVTVQPVENPAFSDQFARTRWTILGLTIGLILTYLVAIIPMDLFTWGILVYSIPIAAFYNIVECICFSGCKQFDFCTVLVFRIIWVLHDFAYFITYCMVRWSGLAIGVAIFLALAVGLNIAIMIFFGKLPRYNSCCCCPANVHSQQTLQYMNGPILQPGVQPPVQTAQILQLPNGQQVVLQTQSTTPVKGTKTTDL